MELHVPTVLLKMLKQVEKSNPHAEFLISDFSSFTQMQFATDSSVELNCPMVSIKQESAGAKLGFRSALDPEMGKSDIFYATDFDFLQYLFAEVFGKSVTVVG